MTEAAPRGPATPRLRSPWVVRDLPHSSRNMNSFDELLRTFWSRPAYQRVFLAFTVGLFLSCAARVSKVDAQPSASPTAAAAVTHAAR